ncbi:hypothetical protein P0D88_51560 [Paraburkholderia sp. RL18-103-BIB-C]|uniref:hypothetical protein n=1 Tax=Paraburkholderia sp. RL18-103-BIB-C TaxID=3031637 RepID=UPI0038B7A03C
MGNMGGMDANEFRRLIVNLIRKGSVLEVDLTRAVVQITGASKKTAHSPLHHPAERTAFQTAGTVGSAQRPLFVERNQNLFPGAQSARRRGLTLAHRYLYERRANRRGRGLSPPMLPGRLS